MKIFPSIAKGQISAPPSKSMAHRYLICAGLSDGISIIHNIDLSEDIKATIGCLNELGASIKIENHTATVKGVGLKIFERQISTFNCNESGSTLRFFIPLALLSPSFTEFTGSKTLLTRPLSVYEKIFDEQKIKYKHKDASLLLQGQIQPGTFTIPGNISSQFITGLLFTLPLLNDNSKIILTDSIESKPYIFMTQQVLSEFGIKSDWTSENEIFIKGNQKYKNIEKTVEGDYSNSAFFEAFNYLGGKVLVSGLNEQSLQGDKVYCDLYKKLKNWNNDSSPIDISDCPDLGPILITMASALNGGIFNGTERLKIKESDRGTVMCQELKKFGVKSQIEENKIIIFKSELQPPQQTIFGHNDHRIVMALSTLLTITGGTITGIEAVKKSLPDYFERLKSLGIQLELEGDEKWVG